MKLNIDSDYYFFLLNMKYFLKSYNTELLLWPNAALNKCSYIITPVFFS